MNDKMAPKQDSLQIMNESIRKMERITSHSKTIDSFSSAQNKLNRVLNPIDKLPMMKVREEMNQKLGVFNYLEYFRKEKSAIQMIREAAEVSSAWHVDSVKLRDVISSTKLSDLIEESPIQKLLRNKTFKNEFLSVSSKIFNDIHHEFGINDENDFETFKYEAYDAIKSDKEIVEKVEEFIAKKATAKDEATIKTIEEGYYTWLYETFLRKNIPLKMIYWVMFLTMCLGTYSAIRDFFADDRPEVHNHFYNNNYQINSESNPTRIKQLLELKEAGVITDQEFEDKKKKLLDDI